MSDLQKLVLKIENYKAVTSSASANSEEDENTLPFTAAHPVPLEAIKYLYDNKLVVNFDWANWDEGKNIFKNEDPGKFNNLDKQSVLKLLTAVARNDKFNEGAWNRLFESGDAYRLFRRLLEFEES